MKHTLRFPEKFLWGASTASYQVEGGIENCDWAEAAREGRVPVCGAACDHYNRYESDLDNAVKLGHNCHKISLEWARLEPAEGQFDLNEAKHYRNVIQAIKVRGLEPFVNLWHFTLPLWFSEDGGFENSKSPERFRKYAEFVVKEILDGDVKFFLTINEPEVWLNNGYIRSYWPPFKRDLFAYNRAFRNLVRAHKAVYYTVKESRPDIAVSISKNNVFFEAIGYNPINHLLVYLARYFLNTRFLKKLERELDFVGLNYYFYKAFHRPFRAARSLPKTDMGWDIYPEGFYQVLLELKSYHKPIYIIENGIADSDDSIRKDFIESHLTAVYRAIQAGVNIRGYLYWSLLDNYEWSYGFEKRFGLIEVDFVTQQRKIRNSAFIYKNICEMNALEIEL